MKRKVSFNSPVILIFSIICFASLILNKITLGLSNDLLFSSYHSSLLNPFTYIRFITYVFGHANWQHFIGNITLLLTIGPLLEEKYGSSNMLVVIFSTGIVTGIISYILFPNVRFLGASGVVFSLILMSSFTRIKEGEIPLTLILVAIIYFSGEIYNGIFVKDNVSNFAHILGGIVGACAGYIMNIKNK